jgi:hypothetical protein
MIRRARGSKMHDMIGSGGMLRGWISMWTMQMMWFLAMMTVAVGATAMAELLITRRVERAKARLP